MIKQLTLGYLVQATQVTLMKRHATLPLSQSLAPFSRMRTLTSLFAIKTHQLTELVEFDSDADYGLTLGG